MGEGQSSYAWTTRSGTCEIRVLTLFRFVGPSPFRLRVAVTSG
ncbi:hypothetical protein Rumeso_01188 [Rubellimicrobium mesophilum DSM 19309]|uniref:Uncharacterized protein n=1 Tax=Rubellimicrobium mesophilum DSM 19309 TaxID=442562 RepID=A0A017HS76_9RHOB|nr:hypothetical protein [Rubellimicrobium mesophilum]EYD77241.1 hypothetical protein Rumeso_01188 [Rubellimicrobium mesophilum DSM 19309]